MSYFLQATPTAPKKERVFHDAVVPNPSRRISCAALRTILELLPIAGSPNDSGRPHPRKRAALVEGLTPIRNGREPLSFLNKRFLKTYGFRESETKPGGVAGTMSGSLERSTGL
jgi:hypothetical protein